MGRKSQENTDTTDAELPLDINSELYNGIAARRAALNLLQSVIQRKQALDYALETEEGLKTLSVRDRAFTRMLVSTTLRRMGQIDDLIERAIDKKDTPRNLTLQNILRLGTTQILFMDVPDHAAVDTTVRLAELAGMERQKGFVNGLLRTLTRQGEDWKSTQNVSEYNTPSWLFDIWANDYGIDIARQIAEAHLLEAPLDITVKVPEEQNFWANLLGAERLPTGTLRLASGGTIQDREGFHEGHWWVQDASAAIPATLFGNIKGKTVLDLCAAPGGKTLQLASQGAQVTALDRSANRLKRLTENLQRTHLSDSVTVLAADAVTWEPQTPAPYILLDAPCSATGTMRRHPDVAHLKLPQDLPGLLNIQANLLAQAFKNLEPEGVLIYCTCSLQKSEGEHQIAAFLQKTPRATRLPIMAEELGGETESLTSDGDLRILPFHQAETGGMDGFYVARLTKRAI